MFDEKKEAEDRLKLDETNNDLDDDHCWLGDRKFISFRDLNNVDINLFNKQWSMNHTVLIRNVHMKLNKDLWSPESFMNDFGELTVDLVNCFNHRIVPSVKMRQFWLGFENSETRLCDKHNRPMILKLKDWPPSEDFKTLMPSRFDDLMQNLPIGIYTKRDGCLNLASSLPDLFLKPDLGPKLYIAYSSAKTPAAGTTNLHVDISDAINVMLYVGVDRAKAHHEQDDSISFEDGHDDANNENSSGNDQQQSNKKQSKKSKSKRKGSTSSTSPLTNDDDEILKLLKQSNCNEKQLKRYFNGEKVGAIWHIFLPQDADKIRSFLTVFDIEKGKDPRLDHDPIHDQNHYITNNMLKRLKEDCMVEPFTIIQYLGDAVFIPAGAPHQV